MTDLTIGGETFRVELVGDATKPAVVLSNALGTDLAMWDGQVAALAKHFRVVRYDPRGHGGSSAGATPGSIDRLGSDVLAILDALGIEKAHFVGLSMGGAVGLWLLVHAPARIGRAVLANTAARLSSPEAWNARIASVLAGGMTENAAATIDRWFSQGFAAREPGRVEAVLAMLRNAPPHGYAGACAALRDMDLRAALAAIDAEVLVVTGHDDPVVPDADRSALVGGIAGAQHVALAARHLSNIEAEADFNEAVVAFLTAPARKARPAARAKPAPRKPAPAKRSGAARRSNAARSPLKKAPAKRAAPKKTSRKAATKKAAEAHRRPATKRGATHRAAPKAAAKTTTRKTPPKTAARKAASTRRATPTAKARGAVTKSKPTKRAAKTTKKAPVKKAASKTTKKLPAARRKTTAKPRRPTGRRTT